MYYLSISFTHSVGKVFVFYFFRSKATDVAPTSYYNPIMLSVVIQAGGQSSRMGQDKALKLFLGHPLIQRVAERLRPIADELFVTTNRPADYAFLNLPLFRGPQAGPCRWATLYRTFMCQASHRSGLACDMPFANAELFKAASEIMVKEPGCGRCQNRRRL